MTQEGPVWAAGAMSGTSLDGVDVAVIETDGRDVTAFGPSHYRPYSAPERAVLRAALGAWQGSAAADAAARVVETAHVEAITEVLARPGLPPIALIGVHGQTLAHEPGGRGTHQAGHGGRLAAALGRPVVWDFRSADMRLGGEGAPLAPAYHFALARRIAAQAPVAFLNLGGVGNLTWVDARKGAPEADGALLAFDTGPANAPLDDAMQARLGLTCDRDGALAARGTVDAAVLDRLAAHPYFTRRPPKSLDRDDFSGLGAQVDHLCDADAAATLTAAIAVAAMRGAEFFPAPVAQVLVTGGGRHNPVLMEMLAQGCEAPVRPVEAIGCDGDMLEAQAFAHLGVRVARGLPTSFPSTTGVAAAVGGGEVSEPV